MFVYIVTKCAHMSICDVRSKLFRKLGVRINLGDMPEIVPGILLLLRRGISVNVKGGQILNVGKLQKKVDSLR